MPDTTILAPAKLNLFLRIQGRRPDGYHWLESLVVFLDLADKLTYQSADDFGLSIIGSFDQQLEQSEGSNVILRAARLLAEQAQCPLRGFIHLEKNIPVAAGLGGGSSDAAATLLLLKKAWQLNISFDDLCGLASRLGADVKACLWRKPVIMRGTGNQIESYEKKIRPFSVLLANPLQMMATIKVYHRYDELNPSSSQIDYPVPTGSININEARNDLTQAAIDLCPAIKVLLEELKAQKGCKIASMAGSGATCFALFEQDALCKEAYEILKHRYPGYWWYVAKIQQ